VHPNNQLQAESEVAHCASFLAMFHPLHSIKNEEQYKKLEYTRYIKIQVESMHSLREAIPRYCESTPSVMSKKNWNTKKDKGKSMMHALYILQLAKRCMKQHQTVKKSGP